MLSVACGLLPLLLLTQKPELAYGDFSFASSPRRVRGAEPEADYEAPSTDAAEPEADYEAPSTVTDEVAPVVPAAAPVVPAQWQPTRGRQCYRERKYRAFCQGPRRVPTPQGQAASVAHELGLGETNQATKLLGGSPPAEWVELAQQGSAGSAKTLLWPVENGKLWRGLGKSGARKQRVPPHPGVDIGAAEGALFRAAAPGLVVYSDNGIRGYGNLLVVVHADSTVAFYAHARALYFFPGQFVQKGQILGEVGHTGFARGNHLHFEYRVHGRPRDPSPRFECATELACGPHRQLPTHRWASPPRS